MFHQVWHHGLDYLAGQGEKKAQVNCDQLQYNYFMDFALLLKQ